MPARSRRSRKPNTPKARYERIRAAINKIANRLLPDGALRGRNLRVFTDQDSENGSWLLLRSKQRLCLLMVNTDRELEYADPIHFEVDAILHYGLAPEKTSHKEAVTDLCRFTALLCDAKVLRADDIDWYEEYCNEQYELQYAKDQLEHAKGLLTHCGYTVTPPKG